jgi:osmoprotectant transport system permease protein
MDPSEVFDWIVEHWSGNRGVAHLLWEHVRMSAVALLAGIVLAVPPAVWLGHHRRFGSLAVNVSNVGRAIPSFAILVIGTELFGLREYPLVGSFTTFIALVALAVPPLVTNSYVAVAEVPDEVRDAASGMGLRDGQVLRRVELPLALPLIMAGIRTAAVAVVATATLAAFVDGGVLGRIIVDGRAVNDDTRVFAGALLVAALAVVTELVLGGVQRLLTPKGLRAEAGATVDAVVPG